MKHRHDQENEDAWQILRAAGIVLIVVMGLVLLAVAVAIGLGIGMRILG